MSRITDYFRKEEHENGRPTKPKILPEGFDDPRSDYFVPAELRAHFTSNRIRTLQDQDPNDLARRAAYEIALRDAQYAAGDAPEVAEVSDDLDPVSKSLAENFGAREYRKYAQRVREDAKTRGADLLEHEFGRMLEVGLHLADLDVARKLHDTMNAAARRRRDWENENTCPICGDCSPVHNGRIEFRSLNPNAHWSSVARLSVHSCQTCFAVAESKYLELRSIEDCENGVRADLVRETISKLRKQ